MTGAQVERIGPDAWLAADFLGRAKQFLRDPELFDRLDEARISRNEVSYAAAPVPAVHIEETVVDVRKLIALVDHEVEPALPEWHSGPEDDSGGS